MLSSLPASFVICSWTWVLAEMELLGSLPLLLLWTTRTLGERTISRASAFGFSVSRCTGRCLLLHVLASLCLAGFCLHLLVATALPLNSLLFPSPRQTFFCCYNFYCCSYHYLNTKPPIIITEKVDRQKEQEKHLPRENHRQPFGV